jgi:hypothetical protein
MDKISQNDITRILRDRLGEEGRGFDHSTVALTLYHLGDNYCI